MRKTFHDKAVARGYVKRTPDHIAFRSTIIKVVLVSLLVFSLVAY